MTRATVVKKVAAAAVAVAVVLLFGVPLLRELLDVFGTNEDNTDSVVETIVLWVLAALLVAAIYTCIVDGPRAFARLWSRRRGFNRH
jgi:hypothetical protein